MNKNKNKLRFKKRRPLDMGAIFRKRASTPEQKEQRELVLMDQEIRRAIPNEQKREQYINALIEGLGECGKEQTKQTFRHS